MLGVVVVLVALAGAAVPKAAAQATPAQTLQVGQYETLDSAAVKLMVPRDGRLAGYGFETQITGVAFTDSAGALDPVAAAPGDQLAVIAVSQIMPDQSRYYDYPTTSSPTYTLTAGATRITLGQVAQSVPSTVSRTWAAAIPDGSPATLTATFAGFSQSFDLRAGGRSGTSPAALYRDPTRPDVAVGLSAAQDITATGSPDDPVTIHLAPRSATLGYFQPGPTHQAPPPPDQAWLIVDLGGPVTATDSAGARVDCPGELTYPSVYLQTPAGRVRQGAAFEAGPGSGQCMSDIYGFEVPATLTSATFVVDVSGTVGATDVGTPITLTFAPQTADISVSLPPLPASPGQGYLPDTATPAPGPSPTATVTGPATNLGHRSGSPLPAVIAVIVLVVVLAAAGAWAARRRRGVPVRPVTRIPRALLAPPGTALTGPAVGELAAAPAQLTAGPPPGGDPFSAEAEPAPTATATAAPTNATPTLVIGVLGPPVVEGLRKAIRRRGVTRLLYALALHHDRPVTVEQLRDLAATTDTRSEAAETVMSYASILRAASPEGALPPIGADRPGYQLDPRIVDTDVAVFDALTRQAGDLNSPEQIEAALKALSLVRGAPLAGQAWYGIEDTVRDLTTRIERLAVDTARAALESRDARRAEQAVAAGLKAVPGSPILWETRMVAAAGGSGYGLHRAWADTQNAIGADAQMLAPTFQRLANGRF